MSRGGARRILGRGSYLDRNRNIGVVGFGDTGVVAVLARLSRSGHATVWRRGWAEYGSRSNPFAPPQISRLIRAMHQAVREVNGPEGLEKPDWVVIPPSWMLQVVTSRRDRSLSRSSGPVDPESLERLEDLVRQDLRARGFLPVELHVQSWELDGRELVEPLGRRGHRLACSALAVCLGRGEGTDLLEGIRQELPVEALTSPAACLTALLAERLPQEDLRLPTTRTGLHLGALRSVAVLVEEGRIRTIRLLPVGALEVLDQVACDAGYELTDVIRRLIACRRGLDWSGTQGEDLLTRLEQTVRDLILPELPLGANGGPLQLSADGLGVCLMLDRFCQDGPGVRVLRAPFLSSLGEEPDSPELLLAAGAMRAARLGGPLGIRPSTPALLGPPLARPARGLRRVLGGALQRWFGDRSDPEPNLHSLDRVGSL